MLKMGLPIGAVKNAVQRDGKDGSVMDLDPNKSLKFQQQQQQSGGGGEEEAVDTGVPLKDDPEYAKVRCVLLLLRVCECCFAIERIMTTHLFMYHRM